MDGKTKLDKVLSYLSHNDLCFIFLEMWLSEDTAIYMIKNFMRNKFFEENGSIVEPYYKYCSCGQEIPSKKNVECKCGKKLVSSLQLMELI